MLNTVVSRTIHLVLVLLLVTFMTAFLMDLTPGDPAYAVLGFDATPEAVAKVHADLGLDRPLFERYFDWLGNAVQGDLGLSYRANVTEAARRDVTDEVLRALPVTLELMVLAMAIALAIAVPLGVYSAYKRDGLFDRVWGSVSSILVSTPAFVAVPVLVYVLVLRLKLFPATGWVWLTDHPFDNLHHAVLPAFVLALDLIPRFAAVLRADLSATLEEDFVLNARAKGVSPAAVLFRHALRPSSFSLLTSAGISLGHLIGGTVIVEFLFAFPGIGSLLVSSVQARDVNTVQGVVLFIAAAYVVINTSIDLAYGYLDPRVRLRERTT